LAGIDTCSLHIERAQLGAARFRAGNVGVVTAAGLLASALAFARLITTLLPWPLPGALPRAAGQLQNGLPARTELYGQAALAILRAFPFAFAFPLPLSPLLLLLFAGGVARRTWLVVALALTRLLPLPAASLLCEPAQP
jgi:hypothetical protein